MGWMQMSVMQGIFSGSCSNHAKAMRRMQMSVISGVVCGRTDDFPPLILALSDRSRQPGHTRQKMSIEEILAPRENL